MTVTQLAKAIRALSGEDAAKLGKLLAKCHVDRNHLFWVMAIVHAGRGEIENPLLSFDAQRRLFADLAGLAREMSGEINRVKVRDAKRHRPPKNAERDAQIRADRRRGLSLAQLADKHANGRLAVVRGVLRRGG